MMLFAGVPGEGDGIGTRDERAGLRMDHYRPGGRAVRIECSRNVYVGVGCRKRIPGDGRRNGPNQSSQIATRNAEHHKDTLNGVARHIQRD